jgi:Tfp pilus assembly protein PilF
MRRAAGPPAVPARVRRSALPWVLVGLAFLLGIGLVATLAHSRRTVPQETRPAAAPSPRTAAAQAHLDRARKHAEAQELAEAQAELDQAQALAPQDAEVAFAGAELAYRTLQMEKAERQFRRVVELDPRSAAALASLALVLLEQGQSQAAVDATRQAIALDSNDARLLALLGKGLLRLGQPREAAEALERALQGGVRGAEARATLGRARDLLGQTEAALSAFDESLRLDPQLPLARFWRAECLRRAGRAREAERELAAYRRCQDRMERIFRLELKLTQDASDVRAWLELARLRVERGFPSQAVPAVARAEQLAPGDPEVRRVRDLVQRAVATTPDAQS